MHLPNCHVMDQSSRGKSTLMATRIANSVKVAFGAAADTFRTRFKHTYQFMDGSDFELGRDFCAAQDLPVASLIGKVAHSTRSVADDRI